MAARKREVYIGEEEIVKEIQTCLPVRSLLRFRCVCKSWNTLIQNPDFVTAHLRKQKQNALPNQVFSSLKLLIQFKIIHRTGFKALKPGIVGKFKAVTEKEEIKMPEIRDLKRPLVIGICNGLVCLSYDTRFERNKVIALWNPATRDFKFVPECNVLFVPHALGPPRDIYCIAFAGFGYDRQTDCYKVVKFDIAFFRPHLHWKIYRFTLYKHNGNSWKPVKIVSYNPETQKHTLPKLGLFETVVCQWQFREFIICFDMEDEKFSHAELPCHVLNPHREMWCLSSINEYPAVMVFPKNDTEKYSKLWVLERVGEDQSWVIHASFEQLYGVSRPLGIKTSPSDFLNDVKGESKIIGLWKDYGLSMQTTESRLDIGIFNMKTQEFRNINTGIEFKRDMQVFNYFESMTSIYGKNYRRKGIIHTYVNGHPSKENENPNQVRKAFGWQGLIFSGILFLLGWQALLNRRSGGQGRERDRDGANKKRGS